MTAGGGSPIGLGITSVNIAESRVRGKALGLGLSTVGWSSLGPQNWRA